MHIHIFNGKYLTENKGERYLNLFCQNYYQVVSSLPLLE